MAWPEQFFSPFYLLPREMEVVQVCEYVSRKRGLKLAYYVSGRFLDAYLREIPVQQVFRWKSTGKSFDSLREARGLLQRVIDKGR